MAPTFPQDLEASPQDPADRGLFGVRKPRPLVRGKKDIWKRTLIAYFLKGE
jgi:hypothetical protein